MQAFRVFHFPFRTKSNSNPTPDVGNMPNKIAKQKLTPVEEADAIIAQNLANIRKKLARGGSLTKQEIKTLEDSAHGKSDRKFCRTQVELAEALGISTVTLWRVLKREGCPQKLPSGNYPVEEIRAFYRPGSNIVPKTDEPDPSTPPGEEPKQGSRRERLLCERLEKLIAHEEWEREIARRQWMKREEVAERIRMANTKVRNEIERRLFQVAPAEYAEVQGEPQECAAINRRHLEEAFTFLQSEVKRK